MPIEIEQEPQQPQQGPGAAPPQEPAPARSPAPVGVSPQTGAERMFERRMGPANTPQEPKPADKKTGAERMFERRQQQALDLSMASFAEAVKKDPGVRAEAQQIARDIGADPDSVERNMEVMRRYRSVQAQRLRIAGGTSPVLAEQMEDLEFARIAHDDTEQLGAWERMFRQWELGGLEAEMGYLGERWRAHGSNLPQPELDRLAFLRARVRAAARPQGFLQGTAKFLGQQATTLPEALKGGVTAATGVTAGVLLSGQLEAAPLIPASFVAGTVAGLGMQAYRVEAGHLFVDMMDQLSDNGKRAVSEHDRTWASRLAVTGGLANMGLELVGAKMLAKGSGLVWSEIRPMLMGEVKEQLTKRLARPTLGQAGLKFVKGVATGVGGEVITEVGQEAINIAMEEVARQLSDHPELVQNTVTRGEIANRLIDTALETAQGVTLIAGFGPTIRLTRDLHAARDAEHTAQFWAELGATRDKSKLAERDINAAEQFLLKASRGTTAEMTYIDGQTAKDVLQQADDEAVQKGEQPMSARLEAAIPGITNAINTAAAQGQDLAVPTGTIGAKIAGTELYPQLLPHLRLHPEAKSLHEAQEILSKFEASAKEAEKLLAEADQNDKAFADSAREVETMLEQQLVESGRTRADAQTEAKLYRDVIIVLADTLKKLPTEVHQMFPLRVRPGELAPETETKAVTEMEPRVSAVEAARRLHGADASVAMQALEEAGLRTLEVERVGDGIAVHVVQDKDNGMMRQAQAIGLTVKRRRDDAPPRMGAPQQKFHWYIAGPARTVFNFARFWREIEGSGQLVDEMDDAAAEAHGRAVFDKANAEFTELVQKQSPEALEMAELNVLPDDREQIMEMLKAIQTAIGPGSRVPARYVEIDENGAVTVVIEQPKDDGMMREARMHSIGVQIDSQAEPGVFRWRMKGEWQALADFADLWVEIKHAEQAGFRIPGLAKGLREEQEAQREQEREEYRQILTDYGGEDAVPAVRSMKNIARIDRENSGRAADGDLVLRLLPVAKAFERVMERQPAIAARAALMGMRVTEVPKASKEGVVYEIKGTPAQFVELARRVSEDETRRHSEMLAKMNLPAQRALSQMANEAALEIRGIPSVDMAAMDTLGWPRKGGGSLEQDDEVRLQVNMLATPTGRGQQTESPIIVGVNLPEEAKRAGFKVVTGLPDPLERDRPTWTIQGKPEEILKWARKWQGRAEERRQRTTQRGFEQRDDDLPPHVTMGQVPGGQWRVVNANGETLEDEFGTREDAERFQFAEVGVPSRVIGPDHIGKLMHDGRPATEEEITQELEQLEIEKRILDELGKLDPTKTDFAAGPSRLAAIWEEYDRDGTIDGDEATIEDLVKALEDVDVGQEVRAALDAFTEAEEAQPEAGFRAGQLTDDAEDALLAAIRKEVGVEQGVKAIGKAEAQMRPPRGATIPASEETRARSLRALPRADRPAAGPRPVGWGPQGPSRGKYATRTELIEVGKRNIGVRRITTQQQAAAAFASLSSGAVEKFEAIVTDKDGKPLAIVGGFKGANDQASTYPATLVAEAFRLKDAAKIWFGHNHPTGNATLSEHDVRTWRTYQELFRGSRIEPMGLFAIAGGNRGGGQRNWMLVTPDKVAIRGMVTTPSKGGKKLAVVERELETHGHFGPQMRTAEDAVNFVRDLQQTHGVEGGVILLDTQHRPVGWFPLTGEEGATLRTEERMDELYRAVSVSNATAAIVVQDDAMAKYSKERGRSPTVNLQFFFAGIDMPVIDVLKAKDAKKSTKAGVQSAWSTDRPGHLGMSKDLPNAEMFQQRDDEFDWLTYTPPRTQDGKYKGAPEWVKTPADVRAMRAQIRRLTREGRVARYWYEQSAREVLHITGGNVADAEKFVQLLAVYSPNSNIWTNSLNAVRAYTHWKLGKPRETLHAGLGRHDENAKRILYDNLDWQGRKTESFYLNLMHEIAKTRPNEVAALGLPADVIEAMRNVVTVDIWMYRALGYLRDQGGNDKGSGKYSWTENEIRRHTAELNRDLAPGEEPWLPHQVQAAIWAAIRTRYNLPRVLEQTMRESTRQGLIHVVRGKDGRKKTIYGKNLKESQQHFRNWHRFAQRPSSKEVTEQAELSTRSFADDLQRMTEVVPWEAIPAPVLKHPILKASPAVQEAFTAEARALLIDENGNDVLAAMLGVGLAFSPAGFGGFEGMVSHNTLAHVLPMREIQQPGFQATEVTTYARAIQFIFRQKAQPWFRPDDTLLESKEAKEAQQFYVADKKTGRTVPNSARGTQAEAQILANEKGDKFEVRGGPLARAFELTFDRIVDRDTLTKLLAALQQRFGADAGFTRRRGDKVFVVNYRDDRTQVPFARSDEEFLELFQQFWEDVEDLGVIGAKQGWAQGKYGHVHDWVADPQGKALLVGRRGLQRRRLLHRWILDRRRDFDELLARYDKAGIAEVEAALALQAEAEVAEARNQRAKGGRHDPAVETPQDEQAAAAGGFGEERAVGDDAGAFHEAGRGKTRGFYIPESLTIFLTKDQNSSTFIHELAHHYLHVLSQLAAQKAHPRFVDDWQTLLNWFGVKDTAEWNSLGFEGQKRHHEAFARSFEQWLWTGKAPSKRLESIFSRVSKWLRRVYGSVIGEINARYKKQFGVDLPALTPEVQDVFSRMLASEQEIKAVDDAEAMADSFTDQQQAGMTDEEWAFHQELVAEAINSSVDEHARASLKAMEWHQKARGKMLRDLQKKRDVVRAGVRETVQFEIRKQPVYRALIWLRSGDMIDADGSRSTQLGGVHKLKTSDVLPLLPEGTDASKLKGRNGIMQENGIPVATAATLFGFPGPRELVQAVLAAKPFDQVVDEQTDAIMERDHSDLATEAGRERLVNQALHHEARGRLIATDLRALDKALGPVRLLIDGAKRMAKRIVGKQTIGAMNPRDHMLAEARQAKLFTAALKEGDIPKMVQAQKARLLQHHLAKEAAAALEEVDDGVETFSFFAGNDEDLAKDRDIDVIHVGRALAAAFGVGPAITSKQQRDLVAAARVKFRAEHRVMSDRVDALIDLQAGSGQSWRDLDVATFRELKEVGEALWFLASKVKQVERAGKKARLDAIVARGQQQVAALPRRHASAGASAGKTRGGLGKQIQRGWNALASLKKFANWAHYMDGGQRGFFTEHFVERLGAALNKYWSKRKDVTARYHKRLMEVFEAAGPLWDMDIPVPEAKHKEPLTLRGKKELLGLLAQAGTESNLEKALVPYGFALPPDQTGDVLVTADWDAFLARMFRLGILTEQDVRFVQFVWDLYAELLPEDQKAFKQMHGFEYETIEHREVHTPFGTLQGGYVPAITDPDKIDVPRPTDELETIIDQEQQMAYSVSSGKGHTIKRNPYYRKHLDLNISRQLQHIDSHLRHTYLQPAIAEVLRIVRNRDFEQTLANYDRAARNHIILPMLQNLALQQTQRPSGNAWWDGIASWLRQGASLIALGFNWFNSVLQLTGALNATGELGTKYFLAGVSTVAVNGPLGASKIAMDKSAFMDERLERRAKPMREDIANLAHISSVGAESLVRGGRKFGQLMRRLAFWPQAMLQGLIDVVTWHGAYQKSIANARLDPTLTPEQMEQEAIAYADGVVRRTQGSNNPEDLAAYETGTPGQKLATQFGSYMNTVLNSILGSQPGAAKWKALFVYLVLPAMAEATLRAFAFGVPDADKDDETDPEELAALYGKSLARNATGLIPVAGPMLLALGESEGNRVIASPAAVALQQAVRGAFAFAELITGTKTRAPGEASASGAMAMGALATLVTGLPLMPFARAMAFDARVREGQVRPTGPIDYARGLLLGR